LGYSLGKAATIWGAGHLIAEFAKPVIDYAKSSLSSIENYIGSGGHINTGTTTVRTGNLIPVVADPLASAPPIDTVPSVPVDQLSTLEQAYGAHVPSFTGDNFGKAFNAARKSLGAGHLFQWTDAAGNTDIYPTNFKEEGMFKGLSSAVVDMLKKGIK
jgi:hypothetical protein